MTFVPNTGPFKSLQGNLLVAFSGDLRLVRHQRREELCGAGGYRVAMVNIDTEKGKVTDFVKNTANKPASQQGRGVIALERPVDVKFGPDERTVYPRPRPARSEERATNTSCVRATGLRPTPERPATTNATTEPAK